MTRRPGAALAVTAAVVLGWANAPVRPLPDDARADRVVVDKSSRRIRLLSGDVVLREYRISLGAQPDGHKRAEGDERTPEGVYSLDRRNDASMAHLAFHVSYPDAADRRAAQRAGRDPGGLIMVHGLRNGFGWVGRLHRPWDWTDGCIAITDGEMDEFGRIVPVGTPIEIRP